jgi:hypothetical protein
LIYKSDFHLTYRWVDISLHTAASGCKFLQYNERQTKTRSGGNTADARQTLPKIWATLLDPERDPVEIYKIYLQKRPADYCSPNHSRYLAPRTSTVKNDVETNGIQEIHWGRKYLLPC